MVLIYNLKTNVQVVFLWDSKEQSFTFRNGIEVQVQREVLCMCYIRSQRHPFWNERHQTRFGISTVIQLCSELTALQEASRLDTLIKRRALSLGDILAQKRLILTISIYIMK